MTITDVLTLTLAAIFVALMLLAEHLFTGHRNWPARWYYAEGLLAELIGLLGWAVLAGYLPWPIALALLAAGVLAGGPDFLWLRHEQSKAERIAAERAAAWERLEASNAELAAKLRCLMAKPATSNYIRRLRELIETAAFATAAIKVERGAIETAQQQAAELLEQIDRLMGQAE